MIITTASGRRPMTTRPTSERLSKGFASRFTAQLETNAALGKRIPRHRGLSGGGRPSREPRSSMF